VATEQFGSAKAAGYLRRWLPSIVTFAEHAVEGFEVPWDSNPVERLMGEVSKRCKNQWMRWTAEGLEAILQLRLVKYADPEYYQAFLDELLQRSTKTAINCDLSIESTSGKVQTALQHDPHIAQRDGAYDLGMFDLAGCQRRILAEYSRGKYFRCVALGGRAIETGTFGFPTRDGLERLVEDEQITRLGPVRRRDFDE